MSPGSRGGAAREPVGGSSGRVWGRLTRGAAGLAVPSASGEPSSPCSRTGLPWDCADGLSFPSPLPFLEGHGLVFRELHQPRCGFTCGQAPQRGPRPSWSQDPHALPLEAPWVPLGHGPPGHGPLLDPPLLSFPAAFEDSVVCTVKTCLSGAVGRSPADSTSGRLSWPSCVSVPAPPLCGSSGCVVRGQLSRAGEELTGPLLGGSQQSRAGQPVRNHGTRRRMPCDGCASRKEPQAVRAMCAKTLGLGSWPGEAEK